MLTGKEFYTRPNHYNKVLQLYGTGKYYLISEKDLITGNIRNDILLTPEQVKEYLNNQDYIIEKVKKSIESHKKYLEYEKQEQEQQAEKERQYNNTYGYTDNMSPMARGKILKTLNKTENYYNNGEYVGTIARKDFIKNILESGGNIEHKTNLKYYARNYELKTKENEYRLITPDGSFYTITKTEYNYALYLFNNVINKTA